MEHLGAPRSDEEPQQAATAEGTCPPPETPVARVLVQDGRALVVLHGSIDATVKNQLADSLDRAAHTGLPVDVDCSGVEFIDSTGLTSLVWLSNLTPEHPRLLGVPPMMAELLRLTGVDSGFAVT